MNAVIYCRVSTAEQTKNLSLPTQRAACTTYCKQHGYAIVGEFIESGESAKTTNRTELTRLLDYVADRKHRVRVMVVYNLSRLSRNQLDHLALRISLKGLHITLRSVTEPIDDTAVGKFMEGILSSVAQFENDQKSERTKAGMMAALERGRWTHQAPLGYRTGSREGPSLIPDDEKAELVRVAFDLMAEGVTAAEALRRVGNLGLRSVKGKDLSIQSFHGMLRNPLYCGRIEVAWGISTRGDFEPLVEPEVFDQVQRRLVRSGRGKARHRRAHPDFPLRRFVRCRKCDGRLTGSWSRGRSGRYPYYSCHRCRSVRVRGGQLEEQFVKVLETLRPDGKYLRLFEAIVRDVWDKRHQRSLEETAVGEKRVGELKDRLVRLDEKHIFDQSVDRRSYVALRDKLRADLLRAEMAVRDASLAIVDLDAALAASEHVLSHAADLWRRATLAQRQKLQDALFPSGLAHDGEKFGTVTTCIAFSQLNEEKHGGGEVASPTGFEPVS